MKLLTKVVGMSQTEKKLRFMAVRSRKGSREIIRRVMKNGVRYAKRKVPVGKGTLRDSITSRLTDRGLSMIISMTARHAIFAEYQKRGAGGSTRPMERRHTLLKTMRNQRRTLRRHVRKLTDVISGRFKKFGRAGSSK